MRGAGARSGALGVLFGLATWASSSCTPSPPAPPETGASAAPKSSSPGPTPAGSASWLDSPSGARPGLRIAQQGTAKLDWALEVRPSGEASLVERKLVCPERWEKRCWEESEQKGTLAEEELALFYASLRGANLDLKSTSDSPAAPGAQLTTLRFERDGSRSAELSVPSTGPGSSDALSAVARLRRAFHPAVAGASQ